MKVYLTSTFILPSSILVVNNVPAKLQSLVSVFNVTTVLFWLSVVMFTSWPKIVPLSVEEFDTDVKLFVSTERISEFGVIVNFVPAINWSNWALYPSVVSALNEISNWAPSPLNLTTSPCISAVTSVIIPSSSFWGFATSGAFGTEISPFIIIYWSSPSRVILAETFIPFAPILPPSIL